MKTARIRAKGCEEELGLLTSGWQVQSWQGDVARSPAHLLGLRAQTAPREGQGAVEPGRECPMHRKGGELQKKSGAQFSVYKAAVPESTEEDSLRFGARGEEAQGLMGRMALERSDGHRQKIYWLFTSITPPSFTSLLHLLFPRSTFSSCRSTFLNNIQTGCAEALSGSDL